MLFKQFIFYIIIASLNSCQTDQKNNIESDFESFINRFSRDTTFQRSRTIFPLKVNQYEAINDRDTLIYKQRSEVKLINFRMKKRDAESGGLKEKMVIDKSGAKATIEIRGIDNGIVVNYVFEKRNGRWMLVSIVDYST